jgi:hypothetical protein
MVLECGHTFCKTCLEKNSKSHQGLIKACPECSTSIEKPFLEIKPNELVLRIMEFLNNLYFEVGK